MSGDPRWETVVRTPRWTAEMEEAATGAGIEVAAHEGFKSAPTTVGMALHARDPIDAMKRVREALRPCDVVLEIADFSDPIQGH